MKLFKNNTFKNTESKNPPNQEKANPDYFTLATNWADDMHATIVASRNRYKLAFYVALLLSIFLAIAIDLLIPLQRLQPLLINHYQDGRVSVQPVSSSKASQAQIESDIVRYVVNRESYDPVSFAEQYSLVNLLSDAATAEDYNRQQSASNKNSPINVLGNKGYRTVHVDSVVFLDKESFNKGKPKSKQNHQNLAQIEFTIEDHAEDSNNKTIPLTVLLSWKYRGMPSDPEDQWRNWDGFTVVRYDVQQRNVGE